MSRWKNTVRKASYLLAAGILFTAFPANGFWFFIPGPYLPQKGFKYGAVYTRAIVYDDNGNPTWVSYGPDGKVAATYGPAVGELAQARVMSASSFRQQVALLKAVKEEHHLGPGEVMSRQTYRGTGFTTFNDQPIAKPDISDSVAYVAVKPKAKRFRTDGGDLILLTLPIDPNASVGDDTESLLLSKDGGVLYQSSGTIGYKAAFHEKDEEGGYRKHEAKIYGPIQGAYLSLSESFIPGETLTDKEGKYSLSYTLPACPGSTDTYGTPLFLELAYRRFNPRGANYLTYWMSKPGYDFCNGLSVISWMLTSIIATQAEPARFPTDFAVDILPIAGQAGFLVPVGGNTAYDKSQPAFTTLAQQQYDLDSDGQYDRAVLGKIVQEGNGEPVFIATSPEEAEIQGVWLSSGEQSSPLPHLTRRPDLKADFGGRGLLSSLSTDDLRNTDLYLFRESDGTLLIERKGLDEEELSDVGTNAETGKFFYTLPLLNARELTKSGLLMWGEDRFAKVQKEWYGFVDEKQYEREADHLRAGETVKIVIINRATGYMGTANFMLRTSKGSDITLHIGDIFLQPPNLKIWARRKYWVDYGLTKGDLREYQIGNEGAALADDQQIEIRTEWLDEWGRPLPEELGEHGFTGRIAKLVESSRLEAAGGSFSSCEPSCEGSSLSQFAIKPGRQLQVIRLPDKVVGKNHLYIHVNGVPKNRHPDFGDGNAIPGRPRLLVPVKVPVYDEGMTLEAIRTYNQAKKADPNARYEKPEPVYNFVYRPEFQFSVYDLEVDELLRTDVEKKTENILHLDDPLVLSDDQLLEIHYSLHAPGEGQPLTPLPGYSFEDDKELVFAVGAEEIRAILGSDRTVQFTNHEHLGQLQPADYLAINLAANNDAGNILWEFGFFYLGAAVDLNRDNIVDILYKDESTPGTEGGEGVLSDKTTPGKPFRFWLNDDYDVVSNLGQIELEWTQCPPTQGNQVCEQWDEPPGERRRNNADESIDTIESERDLEDFAPLALSLSAARDVIGRIEMPPETHMELLANNVGINLFKGMWVEGTEYLRDTRYVEMQTEHSGQKHHLFQLKKNVPRVLTNKELDKMFGKDSIAKLIFEGVEASDQSCEQDASNCYLEFSIWTNGKKVASEKVYLDLLPVKHYYDHYSVGPGIMNGRSASQLYGQAVNLHQSGGQGDGTYDFKSLFPAGDQKAEQQKNEYILFVHGWRMTKEEKISFAETAFKRLYWTGYKGRFGTFTWPTGWFDKPAHIYTFSELRPLITGNEQNYGNSESLARMTGPKLKDHLAALNQQGYKLHVFAHSMGNVVVSEALRAAQGQRLAEHYVASQAAEVASAYNPAQPFIEHEFSFDFLDQYEGGTTVTGLCDPHFIPIPPYVIPGSSKLDPEKAWRCYNLINLDTETWDASNNIGVPNEFDMPPNHYSYAVPYKHGPTTPEWEARIAASEGWGPAYYREIAGTVGAMVNFYNEEDEALRGGEFNQLTKPDFLGGPRWGYRYNWRCPYGVESCALDRLDGPDGEDGEQVEDVYTENGTMLLSDFSSPLDQTSADILAHIIPARTDALGQVAGTGAGSVVGGSLDMNGGLGYKKSNQDHSAQFYTSFVKKKLYWEELMKKFGFGNQ